MNDWQQVVVIILLILCIIRIGRSIYTFFRKTNDKANPCDTCPTGCELKDMIDKKRTECNNSRKQNKKKCCR